MIGSQFLRLGICLVLTACSDKFFAPGTMPGSAGGAAAAGADSGNDAGATSSGGGGGGIDGVGDAGALGGSVETGGVAGSQTSPIPETGLALWLRADTGVLQIQGAVQKWLDQSGNQADGTQALATARPKYLADGFSGKPTIEFDGSNDFLNLPEGFRDFSLGVSGFVVARPTRDGCASMVELSRGSELDDIAFNLDLQRWQFEVLSDSLSAGEIDTTQSSLYAAVQRRNGDVELAINGTVVGTSNFALPARTLRTRNYVGHTLYANCGYFSGQISEIIVYSRPLSVVEMTAISSYLHARWPLPTSL